MRVWVSRSHSAITEYLSCFDLKCDFHRLPTSRSVQPGGACITVFTSVGCFAVWHKEFLMATLSTLVIHVYSNAKPALSLTGDEVQLRWLERDEVRWIHQCLLSRVHLRFLIALKSHLPLGASGCLTFTTSFTLIVEDIFQRSREYRRLEYHCYKG